MNKEDFKIHIIGAGVSGLIAARVLEDNGYSPVIIEATERAGGRMKTDIVNGFQLDHGFQVLLTAYPAAQKYLDFDALELQQFLPGASIFKSGKQKIIGDPLKELSLLFSTLFSGIGNVGDKLKILKLNSDLKKKSTSVIFSEKEQTTFSYLQAVGFSNEIPCGALLLVSDQPMVPEGVKTQSTDEKVSKNFGALHIKIGIESLNQLKENGKTVKHLKFA